VTSILADVRWLLAGRPGVSVDGEDPWFGPVRHTSDYFELLYACALELIAQGKAYVDFLSAAEMANYRGTLTEPGRNSPDRELNRSPAEVQRLSKQHPPPIF
jgi:glutaminyl-tRNA synthetase